MYCLLGALTSASGVGTMTAADRCQTLDCRAGSCGPYCGACSIHAGFCAQRWWRPAEAGPRAADG